MRTALSTNTEKGSSPFAAPPSKPPPSQPPLRSPPLRSPPPSPPSKPAFDPSLSLLPLLLPFPTQSFCGFSGGLWASPGSPGSRRWSPREGEGGLRGSPGVGRGEGGRGATDLGQFASGQLTCLGQACSGQHLFRPEPPKWRRPEGWGGPGKGIRRREVWGRSGRGGRGERPTPIHRQVANWPEAGGVPRGRDLLGRGGEGRGLGRRGGALWCTTRV